MTDYSELKRLAEACSAYWSEEYPDRTDYPDHYIDIRAWEDAPEFEFYCAANPAAVLALIAENERLRGENDEPEWHAMMTRLEDKNVQLEAEVEALRKDAERYRCLIHPRGFDYHESWLGMDKSALDAALDEVMTKEQG